MFTVSKAKRNWPRRSRSWLTPRRVRILE